MEKPGRRTRRASWPVEPQCEPVEQQACDPQESAADARPAEVPASPAKPFSSPSDERPRHEPSLELASLQLRRRCPAVAATARGDGRAAAHAGGPRHGPRLQAAPGKTQAVGPLPVSAESLCQSRSPATSVELAEPPKPAGRQVLGHAVTASRQCARGLARARCHQQAEPDHRRRYKDEGSLHERGWDRTLQPQQAPASIAACSESASGPGPGYQHQSVAELKRHRQLQPQQVRRA